MDWTQIAIVIAILIVVVVFLWAASRRRGGVDRTDDRGPYASGSQMRGDFAALGTTPPDRRADVARPTSADEDAD